LRLLVVGAGGHAKVVVDAAIAAGHSIAGIIGTADDTSSILGHPVTVDGRDIAADGFVIAIGNNRTRATHFAEYVAAGRTPVVVVHPSAIIGAEVALGAGTFVAAGSSSTLARTSARTASSTPAARSTMTA